MLAFSVDASVPSAITGPDALPRSWSAYRAEQPDLWDVVASPDGTMEVWVDRSGLTLRLDGAIVDRFAAENHAVVLAQWAQGESSVERWRREVYEPLR